MGCTASSVAKLIFIELDCFGSVTETVRYVPTDEAYGFFKKPDTLNRRLYDCEGGKTCQYGVGWLDDVKARRDGYLFKPCCSTIQCRVIVNGLIDS